MVIETIISFIVFLLTFPFLYYVSVHLLPIMPPLGGQYLFGVSFFLSLPYVIFGLYERYLSEVEKFELILDEEGTALLFVMYYSMIVIFCVISSVYLLFHEMIAIGVFLGIVGAICAQKLNKKVKLAKVWWKKYHMHEVINDVNNDSNSNET